MLKGESLVGNTNKIDNESALHALERLRPTSSIQKDAIEIVRGLIAIERERTNLPACESATQDDSVSYHIFEDFDWSLFSVFCFTWDFITGVRTYSRLSLNVCIQLGCYVANKNLCSPNEDFGRSSKHSGTHFQSTFHIRAYSIWATFIWKVIWKHVPECLVGLPKIFVWGP